MLLLILLLIILIIIVAFAHNIKIYKGGSDRFKIDSNKNKEYFHQLDQNKLLSKVIQKPVAPILEWKDIPHEIPYQKFDDVIRKVLHIGQLKLFLTELQYLNDTLDSYDENVTMVYAGSSPSHHASYLSKMFPNLKIIMVDPAEHLIYYPGKTHYSEKYADDVVYLKCAAGNRFNIKKRPINIYNGEKAVRINRDSDDVTKYGETNAKLIVDNPKNIIDFISNSKYKYYILEDFFMNDTARMFALLNNHKDRFLFCSDIRSKANENAKYPTDADVLWNSAMQYVWVQIMQPEKCMLKWRTPYFGKRELETVMASVKSPMIKDVYTDAKERGIDFIEDYKNEKFAYFRPEAINIQAFAGPSSTEARLIANREDTNQYTDIQYFDPKEYENKFFYYNRIHRSYGFHNEHQKIFDKKLGLDACGDCGIMYALFKKYYTKFHNETDVDKVVHNDIASLMGVIRRSFFSKDSLHGYYFKPYANIQEIIDEQQT